MGLSRREIHIHVMLVMVSFVIMIYTVKYINSGHHCALVPWCSQ